MHNEAQIAWQIWNLTNQLNDMIWNRYDKDLVQLIIDGQNEEVFEDLADDEMMLLAAESHCSDSHRSQDSPPSPAVLNRRTDK